MRIYSKHVWYTRARVDDVGINNNVILSSKKDNDANLAPCQKFVGIENVT